MQLTVKLKTGDKSWNIFTHGGRNPTDINALEYCIEVANLGAGEILLTSMDRDGTKIGFDNELLSTVSSSIDIPVMIIVGDKEMETDSGSVRTRRFGDLGNLDKNELIEKLLSF